MIHRCWNEITDMEAMKNDIALKQSSASPKNFVWGRRAGFYNSNVLFLFFAFIATYKYKGGRKLGQ